MSQIFISHSARDTEYKNVFNQAFATSEVEAKYEEIEKLYRGLITTQDIETDISVSNAMFVLLSRHVDTLDHTRDWVGYEVGIAKGPRDVKKDVWVFEHISEAGQLRKVIPNFDHYVIYDSSDVAVMFIKSVIESYNTMRTVRSTAVGAGLGAVFGVPWIGAGLGAAYSNLNNGRPQGVEVVCSCRLKYQIHLPATFDFYQCANCRQFRPKPVTVPQFS